MEEPKGEGPKIYSAEDLERLKTSFISIVSHEFRTPLTIIQSSSELIQYYFNSMEIEMPKSIEKSFTRIQRELNTMTDLMERTLESAKLEKTGKQFSTELTDLRLLCNDVMLHDFSDREDQRYVDFQIEGKEREVLVDARLIIHILQNLLSNAFKYSEENPALIIGYGSDSIRFTVIDNGIGIPEAEQQELFQSFFRGSNTASISGTGLGMVVVKNFVDLHGGTIVVESVQDEFTKVVVELPV